MIPCPTSAFSRPRHAGFRDAFVKVRPPTHATSTKCSLKLHASDRVDAASVVCIGEALFDLISEQPGLPRKAVTEWTPYAGGAPANVSTSLARLGVRTKFVSALGKDQPGQELVDLLASTGVDVSAVQRVDAPTRDVYVVLDADGDREFSGFGSATDSYCDCFIDPNALPVQDIQAARVVVTGTLGLAYEGSRSTLYAAADMMSNRGGSASSSNNSSSSPSGVLLVDVNWRPVFWSDPDAARGTVMDFLKRADVIKVSDSDLEWLIGMTPKDALADVSKVLSHFAAARGVLVTAGGSGAAYCFRSASKPSTLVSGFVPAFPVDVVDTTGAGDAFTAGIIYRMIELGGLPELCESESTLRQAVVFAAACGALTTTKKGAIQGQPQLQDCLALFEKAKDMEGFF